MLGLYFFFFCPIVVQDNKGIIAIILHCVFLIHVFKLIIL